MRFFPDGYLFKIAVHCSLDCSFEVSDILCMYILLWQVYGSDIFMINAVSLLLG